MRRWLICLALCLWAVTLPVRAEELPSELWKALPGAAEKALGDIDLFGEDPLGEGAAGLWEQVKGQAGAVFCRQMKGAVLVLLTALLCGMAEGTQQGAGGEGTGLPVMVGALAVTLLTVGSMDSLMGLGAGTIREMGTFSKALLPTLAAATAAAGALTAATAQQISTVFVVDVLQQLIRELLLPMVYLYVGLLAAGAMLSDNRLSAFAAALKKCVSWLLSVPLIAFTVYLSVAGAIRGSVDGMRVRVVKSAISGAIPVVGSILADVSETVLAGAGMLKGAIGVFGMLGVLAICAVPFLHLGIQYLLYKLAALFSGVLAPAPLTRLIDGLAGAFGLVLGMTGACAVLLLVSILSSVAAVVPW